MACGSSRHPTFEMLARAIMLTKAPTPQMLNEAAYIYSEEKADTYLSKQMDGYYQCDAIVRRFDNQDIFKINLYADGTLKMPDGQIITPHQPYDASALYKADKQIEIKARAIYEGAPAVFPTERRHRSSPRSNPMRPRLSAFPPRQPPRPEAAKNMPRP